MRVSRSALWVMPALLLSLVTAIPLQAQKAASDARSKSAQDDWNAPTQAAPEPQGSKPGKSDTKNVADGAAKGQASEGTAPNPNGGRGGGKGNSAFVSDHNSADGAAKGQATEGIYFKPHDSSSPSTVINGQSSGAGDGKTIEHPMGEMKSKSAHDDWTAPTATAPQQPSGNARSKSGMDDWGSQTKTAAPPQGSGSGTGTVDKNIGDGAAKGHASELTATNPNGGSGGKGNNSSIQDSKNISDGAAKGQAVDGMVRNPNGGSGGGKGNNSSVQDSKNISDGAAKGQATDGIIRTQDSSSPGKNISDGAAKGQATEGMVQNPNGGGNGTVGADKFKSKSGMDDWQAQTRTAQKPSSGPTSGKSAQDDWQAPTSIAPKPATGTTKGKSATDDWQTHN